MTNNLLLQINELSVFDRNRHAVLHRLGLTLRKHRTLAIVGESGSGKSLLAKAMLGLLPPHFNVSGEIFFEQQALHDYDDRQWRKIRGKDIHLMMQNAMGAFDPRMRIGAQFKETLTTHFSLSQRACQQKISSALQEVKLDKVHNLLESYLHQLSGGQLQRVMIAIALALEPLILIADEPTTALDAITQYEVIQEFKRLVEKQQTTLIFISHDLGLVREIADDIAVMKDGTIIEYGSKEQLFTAPQQPYTQFLLNARHQLTQRFANIMAKPYVINR